MDGYLNTSEAADYLRIREQRLREYCRSGAIQHGRCGPRGDYRFRREWLDAFLSPSDYLPADIPQERCGDVCEPSSEFARMVSRKRGAK